jgi:glycosyltransferase involved in cell wall biosynthesis
MPQQKILAARRARQKTEVVILICTYNGQQFIREQLDSIENQTFDDWRVIVSDDGSIDSTLEILKIYRERWGASKLEIRSGPKKGFCRNFLSIISDTSIEAKYFALCDQDDVWLPKKLESALKFFKKQKQKQKPMLYGGRTNYVTKSLDYIQMSDLYDRRTSFRNAIVQSIAGGNTMMFNKPLRDEIAALGPVKVVSHDWWLYIVCEALGGITFYDQNPKINYRQHENSLIGSNVGFVAKIKRLSLLLRGYFWKWNSEHILALRAIESRMTEEARFTYRHFSVERNKGLIRRLRMIEGLGLYRHTWDGMAALYLGALLKKI